MASLLRKIISIWIAILLVYLTLLICINKVSKPGNFYEFKGSTTPEKIKQPQLRPLAGKSIQEKMFPDFEGCLKIASGRFYSDRENFWILNNFVPAAKHFPCDGSVTYTTHGDFTYFDNLPVLAERWQGPISVAVFAPRQDFTSTLEKIVYVRECASKEVKDLVTFHVFFPSDHLPLIEVPSTEAVLKRRCESVHLTSNVSVRHELGLTYPINVARNVARANANTYFIFPSDIELYPSVNFIPEFLQMLKRPDISNSTKPRVYVFPIFEIAENQEPPRTKTQLQKMLKKRTAVPFHINICRECHRYPKSKEWMKKPMSSALSVLATATREKSFANWEPLYVGTDREPLYDERLSWDGRMDKMTQVYLMCVLGYEFHILDNAFLVHKPGIKTKAKDAERLKTARKQTSLITWTILPEYTAKFGKRDGCAIYRLKK